MLNNVKQQNANGEIVSLTKLGIEPYSPISIPDTSSTLPQTFSFLKYIQDKSS